MSHDFQNGVLFCLQTSTEMSKIHDELNEKISAVRRLQMELNRRDDEGDDILENLKKSIAALERENASLKVSIILCHCKKKKTHTHFV